MNTTDLDKLRGEMTAGPWAALPWGDGSSAPNQLNVTCPHMETMLIEDLFAPDARAIAMTPDLIAEVLRLRADNEVLREEAESLGEALINALGEVDRLAKHALRAPEHGKDG